jgi:hypothetical protein
LLRVGKGEEEIQQMRAVVEVPEEVTIFGGRGSGAYLRGVSLNMMKGLK